MNKYILFFIYLIPICLCGYLPLKKRNGFDDNVCAYKFSSVNYVKTCKEGQFCKEIGDETSICEDIPNTITLKTLGEDCKYKFECETGLSCYGGKCKKYDTTIGCLQTDEEAHRIENGWSCKKKSIEDYCLYSDDTTSSPVTYSPDYSKVCGEITFKSRLIGTGQGTEYTVLTIKSAYIGTVPDGKFVQNPKACKSGFALPFYPDDSLKDPSYDERNAMYLKCITINDFDYKDSSECTFKYDTDKIYYSKQLHYSSIYPISVDINGDQFNYGGNFCFNNLMTKLEMFSKYIGIFTEDKQKNCAVKENYNEPYTCNDNELRKWLYYYDNPEHYILYYDEKGNDVANYLIQLEYPLYQSSKILNIKYFISLLLLLLF